MKCETCHYKPASQLHHKFSQTKWAKKLYGDLIHDVRNLQHVCADCHVGHASLDLVHWNESQFCEALGIAIRSKTGIAELMQSMTAENM